MRGGYFWWPKPGTYLATSGYISWPPVGTSSWPRTARALLAKGCPQGAGPQQATFASAAPIPTSYHHPVHRSRYGYEPHAAPRLCRSSFGLRDAPMTQVGSSRRSAIAVASALGDRTRSMAAGWNSTDRQRLRTANTPGIGPRMERCEPVARLPNLWIVRPIQCDASSP